MGPELRKFLTDNANWSDFARSLLDQDAAGRDLTDRQRFAAIQMAQRLGKKTGRCQICHRKLSDPVSVERGIGPICEGRMQ